MISYYIFIFWSMSGDKHSACDIFTAHCLREAGGVGEGRGKDGFIVRQSESISASSGVSMSIGKRRGNVVGRSSV